MDMNMGNDPTPQQAERTQENSYEEKMQQDYQALLKKEQEALESKMRGDATQKFDEVRKLGFATSADVKKEIEGIFGKFVSEVQQLRDENTKLREWVMRAKMQGLNSGATEDKPQSQKFDMLGYKPAFR